MRTCYPFGTPAIAAYNVIDKSTPKDKTIKFALALHESFCPAYVLLLSVSESDTLKARHQRGFRDRKQMNKWINSGYFIY